MIKIRFKRGVGKINLISKHARMEFITIKEVFDQDVKPQDDAVYKSVIVSPLYFWATSKNSCGTNLEEENSWLTLTENMLFLLVFWRVFMLMKFPCMMCSMKFKYEGEHKLRSIFLLYLGGFPNMMQYGNLSWRKFKY